MEWLMANWFILVGIIAFLVVIGLAVYKFAGLPTKTQIAKIKEWLLYAVVQAEKELGSGTGKLKLLSVYTVFIARFPVVAKLVSFETFELWVDEALSEMATLLKDNQAIATYVGTK